MSDKKRAAEEGDAPAVAKKTKVENVVIALLGASTPQALIASALDGCPTSAHVALAAFKNAAQLDNVTGAEAQLVAAFVEHGESTKDAYTHGIAALSKIVSWGSINASALLDAALSASEDFGDARDLVRITMACFSSVGDSPETIDSIAAILEELEADADAIKDIADMYEAQCVTQDLVAAFAQAARAHSLSNKTVLGACADALCKMLEVNPAAEEWIKKSKISKVFRREGVGKAIADLD